MGRWIKWEAWELDIIKRKFDSNLTNSENVEVLSELLPNRKTYAIEKAYRDLGLRAKKDNKNIKSRLLTEEKIINLFQSKLFYNEKALLIELNPLTAHERAVYRIIISRLVGFGKIKFQDEMNEINYQLSEKVIKLEKEVIELKNIVDLVLMKVSGAGV